MKGKPGKFFKVSNFVSNLSLKRKQANAQQWMNDGDQNKDTSERLSLSWPFTSPVLVRSRHTQHTLVKPCSVSGTTWAPESLRRAVSLPHHGHSGSQGPLCQKWGDVCSTGSQGAPLDVTRPFLIWQTR